LQQNIPTFTLLTDSLIKIFAAQKIRCIREEEWQKGAAVKITAAPFLFVERQNGRIKK